MYEDKWIILSPAGKKFWKTKKKGMRLIKVDKPVELHGGYWDGGSKSEYYAVTKAGVHTGLATTGCPPFDPRPVPKVSASDDIAIVCRGWFCGKEATVYAYVTDFAGWIYGEEKIKTPKV